MRKQTLVLTTAFVVMAAASLATAGDHEFVGAAKCKMCHKVQYASWETTKHAMATETAKASADLEWGADCMTCHTTNASEDFPGVQCEACHGAGADFKKMSIMKDRDAAIANGLVIPSQETCDACHVGNDHATAMVYADQLNNKEAIHEFKNPPGE
jgi:DnaJ-class molecular chaperone